MHSVGCFLFGFSLHINTLRECHICNAWSMMDLFLCSVKLSLIIIVYKAKVPKDL
uniref:Uncharacterized protein n=1 Tax=Setaria italica TaxID=4555 RepID=K3Z1Z6_SETIT